MRIGSGYDVHRLVPDRELILGGVRIPSEKGLLGHSDADVLIHAVMDALLGAAALGDIGMMFPDSDDRYKGIASTELLRRVVSRVKSEGFRIENVDATVVCQAPKLSPFREEIRKNLAWFLEIEIRRVSVKFTTEEGLGFTGAKEGISSQAVCLLSETKKRSDVV